MLYLDKRILIKRTFENYYLFLDNEFRIDKNFGKKIYQLNNERFREILFLVRAPYFYDEKSGNQEAMLTIPVDYETVKLFYEMSYENKYDLNQLDYLITNKSGNWEAFISYQHEICIFGCSDELNDKFKMLFNPYGELSLDERYKSIWDAHSKTDIKDLKAYLEYTFNFSKNNKTRF